MGPKVRSGQCKFRQERGKSFGFREVPPTKGELPEGFQVQPREGELRVQAAVLRWSFVAHRSPKRRSSLRSIEMSICRNQSCDGHWRSTRHCRIYCQTMQHHHRGDSQLNRRKNRQKFRGMFRNVERYRHSWR